MPGSRAVGGVVEFSATGLLSGVGGGRVWYYVPGAGTLKRGVVSPTGALMHPHPVALVTGGSRGLGRGICLELARAGYALAINYAANEAAARETQQQAGPAVSSLLCRGDVGSPA